MELPEQIQTFRDFLEVNEVYLRELHEQVRKGNAWFTVQFADLARHNPELAELLLEEPEDVLKAFQIAIDKMDLPRASEAAAPKIEPRIINLPPQQIIEIRNVRSKHLNRFVQLIGVVRQKSDVRPQMTSARFECPACGNIIPVLQIDQKFQEPSRCGCGRKGKFKLLTKELVDAQSITLEEAPEDLDGGEQPKRLKLFLKNDLVSPLSDKRTNPGSKITVVGVIKEVPIVLQTGGQSTRFDLILEVNALESIQEDFTEISITPEQEKDIRELSQDPDLFEKLVSSIAPNIYGHEPIKQALLLQMFGGVHKARDKGIKSRGDIHMLLIGDPGSGKSVLLKRVSAIAPKARFVSGKGASGAGLTAAVVKDDFLKGWALEAGALVLANRGLCCTTEDAVFIKEDGSRMTFGELFENETQDLIHPGFRVLGLDAKDLKVKPFAIKQAFRTPNTKKILRVKTRTGRTLDLTEDNEVFTCADSITRWQAIGELKEGDFLAVPKNLPIKNGKKWDENFAYICGLIASDGHITYSARHSTVAFYNSEKYLIDRYRRALEALGWKSTTYTKAPGRTSTIRGKIVTTKKESYVILQTQKAFAQELMGFGIPVGDKSSVRPLDRRIFSYSRDAIAPFLRGVFDGDGSVRQNPAEITLCTGLEQNAKLFQSLFTRLGIVSSIKRSTNSWHCDVRGVKNCRTFLEMIGSSHPEKAARLLQMAQLEKKDRIDILPNHASFFKSLLASRKGEIGAAHYKYLWHHSDSGTAPSRERLEYINGDLDDPALRLFVESDVLWDKIVSLEEISADYVYDFTMIGSENFIANDIVMHNCIDELDKMTDEDTSAMHEALEQQTISISKANIQATLRCETTVLAAANPKFGRFDPYEIISKQIELPPALLSRFDLIFPVRDLPDKAKDEKLASFILNRHKENLEVHEIITPERMRSYIAYARQTCHPRLTDAAILEIKEYYVKMRGGEDNPQTETALKPIPITARQLEALIRLAEASAKMRLSDRVTKRDAQVAIELVHYCLQQIGMDPETGKIDLDRVTSGIGASQRSHIQIVKELVKELEERVGKAIPIEEIVREAGIRGVADSTTEDVIEKLKRSGDVYSPKHGFISRT